MKTTGCYNPSLPYKFVKMRKMKVTKILNRAKNLYTKSSEEKQGQLVSRSRKLYCFLRLQLRNIPKPGQSGSGQQSPRATDLSENLRVLSRLYGFNL